MAQWNKLLVEILTIHLNFPVRTETHAFLLIFVSKTTELLSEKDTSEKCKHRMTGKENSNLLYCEKFLQPRHIYNFGISLFL